MSSDRLVSSLQTLAELLQNERTLGAVLARIAEAATVSVPRCDAASIAISIQGRPATAAMSARVALELDMAQYDADEGPCLTTFQTMDPMRLGVAELNEAFPHVAAAAARVGMCAVLSVPATSGDELVGTMNLYSRVGPFDETAESIALVLATQVAIAISRSPEFAAARGVVDQAQREADDRADVNLATGLLMINESCTAEQAERLLHGAAATDERTVLEIAQRIIEHHRTSE